MLDATHDSPDHAQVTVQVSGRLPDHHVERRSVSRSRVIPTSHANHTVAVGHPRLPGLEIAAGRKSAHKTGFGRVDVLIRDRDEGEAGRRDFELGRKSRRDSGGQSGLVPGGQLRLVPH